MQMGVVLERVRFVMKNYANGPNILQRVKFVMKNYANAPSILDRVKFVMKNYANGPSILERVKFAMKNYANGLSMIIEGVLTAGCVRRLGVFAARGVCHVPRLAARLVL